MARRSMIGYARFLLGARLRLLYNTFRRSRFWAKFGWIVAGLILLAFSVGSGFGGVGLALLLEALQGPELQEGLLESGLPVALLQPELVLQSLLSLLILMVWGILLMSSLGAALSNFYLSSDMDLLVSAPIPMRAIFVAKFLEGLGLAYLLLFALGGPALIGLGIGAGYPWPYFLGALLVLTTVPLIPQSLGTLLIMPLVRVIPPKRLREVLQVLGGLIGVAFYFFSQLSQGQEFDPQTAGRLLRWLDRLNLPFLPQGWAAQGLISLGQAQYLTATLALGAFLLLSGGLYALCLVMAERLYYSGWANLQTAPAAARPQRPGRARPGRDLPLLPRQLQGIILKDLRLFLRDPQSWTSMLWPVAVYALFLVQSLRGSMPGPSGLVALSGSGIVLLLSISAVSRLGLGGIGSERQQIWLLRCAPISPRRILWAKFLAAYGPFVGFSGVMLLLLILLSRSAWPLFWGSWLLIALIGLGVTGISVGLGASFPRIEGEKPQQVVSSGAGCLYFPIVALYTALVLAGLLLPILLAGLLIQIGLDPLAWVLRIAGPLGTVALTALALWLPLKIGAGRLAKLEI